MTIVFTLTSYWVLAQDFPHEIWHEGKIVLTSKDTIYGDVKYDLQNDLIQININKTIQTYSARKILFFEIFDATGDYFRQFYSLPYQVKPNYKVPILFELLYEGPMTLLTREHVVMESRATNASPPARGWTAARSWTKSRNATAAASAAPTAR